MINEKIGITTGYVTTEGDDLYYEVRGAGQPLLMIPGGGGDGRVYSFIADILADEYKVITYDRRANMHSTGNDPQNFDVSRESRDAVAVLNAAGETSAFVLGSSSGAVIALNMVATQPQAIRAVIAHEPPAVRVLPDSEKWQRFFAGVHYMAFRFGVGLAMLRFGLTLGGLTLIRAMSKLDTLQETGDQVEESDDQFLKYELLPIINYKPDTEQIKQNGVKVFMAAGKWTLDKRIIYGRTVPILAEQLDCEMVTFPGHHVSYVDKPQEWAAVLRSVLQKV
jgi:pimeloyl-ACP methyl ester carboxylesterase